MSFVVVGMPLAVQTTGDCQVVQCDGAGAPESVADDLDLPVDGNDCTRDLCTAGVATNPPEAAGTPCAAGVCNGFGACSGCVVAGDCPGVDDECGVRTCTLGVCGRTFTPAGTPLTTQTAGDCQVVQCNGGGGTTSVADNLDLPNDGLECTSDLCTAGVPSNPAVADGTSCTAGGGQFCYAGACEISFVVVRVGDGSGTLSSTAAAVFLEQRALSGGLLRTVPLPIAASGANQPFTLAGSSTSEGNLTLSANGAYLVLAGYAAVPGTTNVNTSASGTVNRVAARANASLALDTSTLFNAAFTAQSVRGAASSDGSAFWVTGNGNTASGGAWHILLGVTGGTQILTVPINSRFCGVFGGQLYGSSGATPFVNVFTIGSGLPTAAGQTATSLAGMPITAGPSPHGFALFDRNATVAGLDTLYVADDRATASGGGVQKWTFDGAIWTLAATFNSGLTSGVRGLAGLVTGANVTLLATTSQGLPNTVVRFVDDGSATPAATVLATVIANAAYRGVAFSPR